MPSVEISSGFWLVAWATILFPSFKLACHQVSASNHAATKARTSFGRAFKTELLQATASKTRFGTSAVEAIFLYPLEKTWAVYGSYECPAATVFPKAPAKFSGATLTNCTSPGVRPLILRI